MGNSESEPMKDRPRNDNQEWRLKKNQFNLAVAGLALTIVGMVISFWFSLQSFQIAKDTQQRQVTAEARDRIRSEPVVEVSYTIAASPDLSTTQDQNWLSRHGYDTLILPYGYYNDQLAAYRQGNAPPGTRYLFLLFKNTGLGPARKVLLEELLWEPAAGQATPAGLDELTDGTDLGPLDRQVYYMILAAVSPDIEIGLPLAGSGARAICLTYTYNGFFSEEMVSSDPYCLGDPGGLVDDDWIKIDPEAAELPR